MKTKKGKIIGRTGFSGKGQFSGGTVIVNSANGILTISLTGTSVSKFLEDHAELRPEESLGVFAKRIMNEGATALRHLRDKQPKPDEDGAV